MVVLRDAIPADAQAIASVRVESWQKAYRGIIPDHYLDSLHPSQDEAHWRESIAAGRPHVIVAEAKGEIVGFSAFGPSRDSDAPPGTGEIWAIYVLPAHWSTGAGRQLCQGSVRQLADLGRPRVSLWVIAGNGRAIDFYLTAGFQPEAGSSQTFELGGVKLTEIRFSQTTGRDGAKMIRNSGGSTRGSISKI